MYYSNPRTYKDIIMKNTDVQKLAYTYYYFTKYQNVSLYQTSVLFGKQEPTEKSLTCKKENHSTTNSSILTQQKTNDGKRVYENNKKRAHLILHD